MIATTKRWLRRNRTNFAIGFGVLSAGYFVGQYVISKMLEMRERVNNERIAKENLKRRFIQNQEDCTFTVLALLPTATENILEALPVENITHELQQQRADRLGRSAGASALAPSDFSSSTPSAVGDDARSVGSVGTEGYLHTSQMGASTMENAEGAPRARKSKAQLWDELKMSSIIRSFTLIYTLALLTIFTRIQLNLLGRRSYVSSVFSLAAPRRNDSTISLENHENGRVGEAEGADFETNRNFLAFSWWLLHRGWRDLMTRVEQAVKEVFGPISPREEVTFQRLSELIIETRKKVEGATEEERRSKKWLPFLLPPPDQEIFVLHESGVFSDSSSQPSSSHSSNPPNVAGPGITMNLSTSSAATTPDSQPSTARDQEPPSLPSPSFQTQTRTPISPSLRHLLLETSDLLDSPACTRVITLLLDALFSRLTDTAIRSQAFKSSPATATDIGTQTDTNPDITALNPSSQHPLLKAKLATILAVVTRQAHQIGNGVPNAYVQSMEGVHEVEALAAVIYTTREDVVGNAGAGVVPAAETNLGSETAAAHEDMGEHAGDPVWTGDAGYGVGEVGRGRGRGGMVGATWGLFEGAWGRVVRTAGAAAGR